MKKMNKAFGMFCAWGIAAVLAGCGQAAPTGNIQQDITADFSSSKPDAGKDNDKGNDVNQGSEELNQGGQKEEKGAFGFQYGGVTLIPGEVFEPSVLGEDYEFSEVPSCAFDGNDRVYTYEKFEVETYIDGNQERIYYVYIIDPNQSTTEGLGMGDDVDKMKSLYGEDFEMTGNSYEYTRENTVLTIITQNDVVVSIQYLLNT